MALFGGKDKKQAAENEVVMALSKNPLLNQLVESLAKDVAEGKNWITTCQGYYDNRYRKIVFTDDTVEVKWTTTEFVTGPDGKNHDIEKVLGSVGYRYTLSGYCPMHEYRASNGEFLTTRAIITLWTNLVKDAVSRRFPTLEILSANENGITYRVPNLIWKDWF